MGGVDGCGCDRQGAGSGLGPDHCVSILESRALAFVITRLR